MTKAYRHTNSRGRLAVWNNFCNNYMDAL